MQRCAYISSTLYFNPDLYICLSLKQISILGTPLNCTVKVIKPLHNIPEAITDRFAAYHPYYKEKLGIILIDSTHNLFLIQLLLKPLSLISISFDCIGRFDTYHQHYKEIPGLTEYAYNFFFSGYLPNSYHYLVTYLTVLANLLFIICIIKTNLLTI